jgi:hypothetical protein
MLLKRIGDKFIIAGEIVPDVIRAEIAHRIGADENAVRLPAHFAACVAAINALPDGSVIEITETGFTYRSDIA